jgi:hypothetical protein
MVAKIAALFSLRYRLGQALRVGWLARATQPG